MSDGAQLAAQAGARLDALDGMDVGALYGRSLLRTRDWGAREVETLCRVAEAIESLDLAGVTLPLFPHELFWALFFDASTRTKSSWAGAAARLGAHPVIVDGSSTQVSHGETSRETGAMLGMNAHALGIRHDLILGEGQLFMREAKAGIDAYLEELGHERAVPIVNLQCDDDHPTQALADLLWLRERFPEGLAGRTIAVTWAYSPSYAKPLSVPQGAITLLTRFGAHVRLAHPEGYSLIPETLEAAEAFAGESGGSLETTHSMPEAFEGADIVYPKSWGPYDLMLDRVEANRRGDVEELRRIERSALERNAGHRDWICDEQLMASTRDALYLHCLPADIGAEVSVEVLERFRYALARQAHHKVYLIMAALAVAKERELVVRLRRFAEAQV